MSGTITFIDARGDGERDRHLARGPQLILALQCDEPTARPARFSLVTVDEARVGRGPRRSRSRVLEAGERCLRLQVPDAFMSSSHARLWRSDDGWWIEDAGSKNGTSLDGELLDRARLEDGDAITLGNTLFIFRSDMPFFADELDRDLSAMRLDEAAITTLDAELSGSFERLMRVADSTVPVLIRGETGSGKELVCRAVHARSGREGPFVAVNCGALPTALVPSELFGSRKGAYSGASENRRGLVRSADRGTLFLDEIAELPLEAQAALLRVLQENEVVPVGADRPVPVDVRIVAATHRDLSALVAAGEFREDLYSRVAGYELTLPPLSERRCDIGLVIGTLLERAGRPTAKLTPEAARALLAHDWPRNIRELEHTLSAALAVAGDGPIEVEHLPRLEPRPEPEASADDDEAARLRALMRQHAGNVSAVARALGTSRSQVRRVAKRFGIEPAEFRR